jgi:hypothetical protein
MSLKTKQIIIEGTKFRIDVFNAIEGQKILFTLIKYLTMLTPAIDLLIAKEDIKQENKEDGLIDKFLNLGLSKIGIILSELMEKIGEENYSNLIIRLLKNCFVCGGGDNKGVEQQITSDLFNIMFNGNYTQLYQLVFEVVKINFISPSLSNKLGMLAGKLTNKTEQSSNEKTPKEQSSQS